MSKKTLNISTNNPLFGGPSFGDRTKSIAIPYKTLNLSEIDVDPNQPRKNFDPEALAELAASIKEHGLINPITVRTADNGNYRLVAGERRLRAARLIGLETIAVIVSNDDQIDLISKQLVENLQREDLTPLERAEALGIMRDQLELSVRDIGKKLSISKSLVQRSLEILTLPEDLKEALAQGIPESKVLLLANIKDHNTRKRLLLEIDTLTRAALNEVVQSINEVSHGGTVGAKKKSEKVRGQYMVGIEEDLKRFLGTKVSIQKLGKDGKGKIQVEFYGESDLERIISKMVSSREDLLNSRG